MARRGRRKEPKVQQAPQEGRQSRRWPAAILIAGLTLAVFLPAVSNQFVNWDDDQNFLNNPSFRGLGIENLRWMFTTFHLGHYQPLTWVSLGLDYTFWGLDPRGYHLTNVLLHALNAALFYFVALRLLKRRVFPAAAAALFFALHPLRVESVAWATERRDVLCGAFYLLSILAYLKAQQEGPRRTWLAVSAAAFAAGLLSKVIAVTLPAVLLVTDFYPLGRLGRSKGDAQGTAAREVWLEKIPYAVLAGVAAWAALALEPKGVAGFAGHVTMLPGLRIGLSLYGLAFYVWKTAVPLGLYPQYVMAASVSPGDWRIVAGAAAAVAITLAAVAWRKRFPAGLAAWACYGMSLLPVLSLARVDPQQYVADHHTYLATLSFALLAGAGLAALSARAAIWAGGAAVVVLAVLSWQQTAVWSDSITLWTYALAGSPDSVVAHNDLGEALAAAGRLDEAIPHFQRAIAIKPNHAHAHYNLGLAYRKQGKNDEALAELRQAVAIEPGYATAHNDLGNLYAERGQPDLALGQYQEALRLQPDFAGAHYNLGNLLYRGRQPEAAREEFQQVVRAEPARTDARNNLGVTLDALGRTAEAMEQYRLVLAVDPQNAEAHNNLGADLEAAGKMDEALVQYEVALRLSPNYTDAQANRQRVALKLAAKGPGPAGVSAGTGAR